MIEIDLSKLEPAPWEVDGRGLRYYPKRGGVSPVNNFAEFAALARNAFDGDPEALAWWEANRKRP